MMRAPEAALLGPPVNKRSFVVHGHGVDVDGPALVLPGDPQRGPEILGEDGPREPVVGVVGDAESLLLRLKRHDRHRRPKRLGVIDIHILGHVGYDDRSHLGGLVLDSLGVAYEGRGALGDRVGDQRLVLLHSSRVDQHEWRVGRPKELLRRFLEGDIEFFSYRLVHDDALCRHAHLPTLESGGGLFQVRILEDYGASLAPQLQQKRLDVFPREAGDDATHNRAPRKVNLLDGPVANERFCDGSRIGRPMIDNVEAAIGQPSLAKHVTERPEDSWA
ncbi:hypothetical protein HG530_001509 [Fusarium avenaceum]|nr:hypothetical protein HG530_001509 [Fusarium avenaceum]